MESRSRVSIIITKLCLKIIDTKNLGKPHYRIFGMSGARQARTREIQIFARILKFVAKNNHRERAEALLTFGNLWNPFTVV